MNNFDKFKNMTIDELAKFLDSCAVFDSCTPWMERWDKKYCHNCKDVIIPANQAREKLDIDPFDDCTICAYCEVYDKCRFFPDKEKQPSSIEIIKMWLEAEND